MLSVLGIIFELTSPVNTTLSIVASPKVIFPLNVASPVNVDTPEILTLSKFV